MTLVTSAIVIGNTTVSPGFTVAEPIDIVSLPVALAISIGLKSANRITIDTNADFSFLTFRFLNMFYHLSYFSSMYILFVSVNFNYK